MLLDFPQLHSPFSGLCLTLKEHLRVATVLCAPGHQQCGQERGSVTGKKMGGMRAGQLQLQQLQQRAEGC